MAGGGDTDEGGMPDRVQQTKGVEAERNIWRGIQRFDWMSSFTAQSFMPICTVNCLFQHETKSSDKHGV